MTAVADQLAAALQKANLYSNLQTALYQEQTVRSQLIQSERLALVGRLLASVSHELNNPLQAIQNALFLLKEETNLSSQANQDLDIILSEAERMAALIERLRGAYRPVRIQDFRPVGLNGLIEDVHALITTHMRQKEIAFEFFPDPDLPDVSGLSDQIRQVVLNLFLNAIEVMQPGGCLTVQTRGLLQQNEDMEVVAEAADGRRAVELAHELSPDVIVMDVGMPGLNGIEATRQITQREPDTKVVALSMHSDRRFMGEMLKAGAKGYLLKDGAFEELSGAIRSVVQDKVYLSPKIADVVVDDYVRRQHNPEPSAFAKLTPREREVLQLMAEGRATKEIALDLRVSIKTVETHRRQIMEKLNIYSVAELTKYAIREGLTSLEA